MEIHYLEVVEVLNIMILRHSKQQQNCWTTISMQIINTTKKTLE